MTPTEREKIDRLLRADGRERPPANLLARLREDVPNEARIPDPDIRRSESYFGRPSVWLTAASLAMLFTFTFMLSRITFLDQSTEPDIATILDQQRRATKISESAAEQTPVGAAARRRPTYDQEKSEVVTENEETRMPTAPPRAVPQTQSASPDSVYIAPVPRAASPDMPSAEAYEAPAVPSPPAAMTAASAREVSRPTVVEKARLGEAIPLPAELRVAFTVDVSGRVEQASIESQLPAPHREKIESVLRQWKFESGRPGTFELLVATSDLQPRQH